MKLKLILKSQEIVFIPIVRTWVFYAPILIRRKEITFFMFDRRLIEMCDENRQIFLAVNVTTKMCANFLRFQFFFLNELFLYI